MPSNKDILKCSKCKWPKHEATEEHIAKYYGYNRLCEPYKTCKKCRGKVHEFYEKHKVDINEYQKSHYQEHGKESRSRIVECPLCLAQVSRQYLPKHKETLKCFEGARSLKSLEK